MEVKPGYKKTEAGVIPEDWELTPFVSLGSVIDGDRGSNYPGSRDFSSDGYCLFLNAGNVTKAGFRFNECAFISREKDERLSKGKLKRDDIVLTTRGTVGNFAHFDFAVSFEHIRINSGMVILRSESAALDTSFLYALLQSHFMEKQIERLTFGSAQPQLTVKGINEFSIVVPPAPEQHAIATALSDVDGLLGGLDRLIAKKRDVKLATMQQLLPGQTRLPSFHGEWEVKRLGEVANIIKGSGLSKSQTSPSGKRPCILYGELFTTYGRVITDVVSRTNSSEGRPSISGDVLMPGSTTTVGIDLASASALMQQNVALGGDILVIRRKNEDYDPVFLASYLTYLKRQEIADRAQGITIYHLHGKDLHTLPLTLPTLPEQTAIAEVLTNMDAELAALEQRREKTRALKQAMMQELLTGRTRLVSPKESHA